MPNEGGQPQPGLTGDSGAAMQEAIRAAQPGAAHAELAKLAGQYTTQNRVVASGATLAESSGEASISAILGGRFLLEQNKGAMFGHAYDGLRVYGYNNSMRRYDAFWLYTDSTAVMTMTGASNDGGKTITFASEFHQAQGPAKFHVLLRVVNADKFVTELHTADSRGPVLEATYTRVGAKNPND